MKRIERAKQFKNEVYNYSFDFSKAVGRLGTSVSSAEWSTDDSSTVTLGTDTLASNVATCPITGTSEGCAMVKCAATLADSQKIIRYIKIDVDKPEC